MKNIPNIFTLLNLFWMSCHYCILVLSNDKYADGTQMMNMPSYI